MLARHPDAALSVLASAAAAAAVIAFWVTIAGAAPREMSGAHFGASVYVYAYAQVYIYFRTKAYAIYVCVAHHVAICVYTHISYLFLGMCVRVSEYAEYLYWCSAEKKSMH